MPPEGGPGSDPGLAAAWLSQESLHDDRSVPRELFPLPLLQSSRPLAGRGRRSQRRALHRWKEDEEINHTIAALNSMYDAPLKGGQSSFARPSAAQVRAIGFIKQSVSDLGRPPPDLSGSGALRMLRAAGTYDDTDQDVIGVPSPYIPESVSLPSPGWQPISLADLWGADGPDFVDEFCRSKLLPESEARRHVQDSGIERPYWDPLLKHKPTYGKFLSRLLASNLIDFVTEPCREEVAIFFVTKKGGRLRMIVDARRSNCHFTEPDPVKLCTGESLARIETDGPLTIAMADLKDAFYHLGLPLCLRDFFGLPGIQAGLVEGLKVDGKTPGPKMKVYPRLAVVPMGWSWALWVCQCMHERLVEAAGLREEARLRDRQPVPESRVLHTQYVDNLICIGQGDSEVLSLFQQAVQQLKKAGLQVHEEEVTNDGAKVLGWEIQSSGRFGPSLHRAAASLA